MSELKWLKKKGDHCLLQIKALPGAKKSEIVGLYGDEAVKIRIKAPPVDGKANSQLTEFLAEVLSLKISQVVLLRGGLSTFKSFEIFASAEDVHIRLQSFLS